MNHLKDVGMHEDREYLDVFRLNVMHAVHAKEGQHVARGVLKDLGMADRMKRPDTGAPVDTTTALHASGSCSTATKVWWGNYTSGS